MNTLINALCTKILTLLDTLGAQFLTLGASVLASDHAILNLDPAIDARLLAIGDTHLAIGTVSADSLALDELGANRTFCPNLTFCTNLLPLGALGRAINPRRALGRSIRTRSALSRPINLLAGFTRGLTIGAVIFLGSSRSADRQRRNTRS